MLSDKSTKYLLSLLDLIVMGIELAPEVYASYQEARGKLDTMLEEGRDPTDEEWNDLNQSIRGLRTQLHGD